MNWKQHIVCDPNILLGKPTIKGTRISVELLLNCLAGGWTFEMIFESYPRITKEDLKALFCYLQYLAEAEEYLPFFTKSKYDVPGQ
jgi:uncharacterized protein (DUF433 family)